MYFLFFSDVLNVLTILTASMPLLTGEGLGAYDHHIVKFCAILYLIQIMAGLTSASTNATVDSEEADVQRLANWVSECVGSSDKVGPSANTVRKAMLHYLRCAALFFHFISDVPLPSAVRSKNKTFKDTEMYEILSEYLSLPKSLSELIRDEDTYGLVNK